MRESKKGEKTHLPMDSTETWLSAQKTVPTEVKHKSPPKDSYETWVAKRVGESRRGRKAAAKDSA